MNRALPVLLGAVAVACLGLYLGERNAPMHKEYAEAVKFRKAVLGASRSTAFLTGLKDVHVVVEELDASSGHSPISRDRLEKEAEDRLRVLGIPVNPQSQHVLRIRIWFYPEKDRDGKTIGWIYNFESSCAETKAYLPRENGRWLVSDFAEISDNMMWMGPCNPENLEQSVLAKVDEAAEAFNRGLLRENGRMPN
jgi:hypothetical protein